LQNYAKHYIDARPHIATAHFRNIRGKLSRRSEAEAKRERKMLCEVCGLKSAFRGDESTDFPPGISVSDSLRSVSGSERRFLATATRSAVAQYVAAVQDLPLKKLRHVRLTKLINDIGAADTISGLSEGQGIALLKFQSFDRLRDRVNEERLRGELGTSRESNPGRNFSKKVKYHLASIPVF
jgi:hypothetical protein